MNSSDAPNAVRSRWSCVDERGTPQEAISPELVLVDPELALRVRAIAVLGPPLPPPQMQEIVIAAALPRAEPRPARLRLAITAVGAAAAFALVTFATAAVPGADERPYVDSAPPPENVTSPSLTVTTTPTQSVDAAPAPARSSKALEGVQLRWRSVPSADYYNVILWSDGTRLRDYWPRRPRLVLVPRELAQLGASKRSIVHWFVYPISVEAGARVAGPVQANGSFMLPAARFAR